MIYAPSQTFGVPFLVKSASNALVDPDASALPVAKLFRNGVLDSAVTVTVTRVATGKYRATGAVPSGYAAGDALLVELQPVTVASVLTVPSYLALGQVETHRPSDLPTNAQVATLVTDNSAGGGSGGASAAAIAAALAALPLAARNQNNVTAPTWADAQYGAWVQAFGAEDVNVSGQTYVRYDWLHDPARSFSLTTADMNGDVVPTGRH